MHNFIIRFLGSNRQPVSATVGKRYGFALLCLTSAFLLRLALHHLLQERHPFLFFIPAALAAGWYGRFGPAMLVLAGGYLLGDYFFQSPRFELGPYDSDTLVTILTYAVITLLGTGVFEAYHRTRDRLQLAQDYNSALEKEIRERQQVQQALELSEHEYRLLFESNPLPTYVFDRETLKFLAVNEATLRHYGYSREEFLTLSLLDIRPPEDIPRLREHLSRISHDLVLAGIWRHRLKDGSLIEVEVTSHPLSFGGKAALLVLANDVTEQRRAARLLQEAQVQLQNQNQELEKRVAERTASLKASLNSLEGVLYHVAHDLRAPLRAMNGFTQLLLNSCLDPCNCEARDFAIRIKEASEIMDAKIHGLIEFGRLGRLEPRFQNVDLTELVKFVLRKYQAPVVAKHAAVSVQYPLPHIWADAAVLEEVLSRLLDNALCFVSPGIAPHIRIWGEQQGQSAKLCIQDNGIGIAPQYHEKIFGIFEQLHQPGTYPGTGIGLAIAKKGVERMGGHIGLQSQPGQGSCFWLVLKAGVPNQAQAA